MRSSPLVHSLVLALIVVLAWGLREGGEGLRDLRGTHVASLEIVDSKSAHHLRRVQLALAARRLPAADAYLDAQHGGAPPWPPLYEAGLAAGADTLLSRSDGDRALSGVDERELERWVAHLAPVLGALLVLLVWWGAERWLRALGLPERAALLAALIVALAPPLRELYALGRLDNAQVGLLLLVLQVSLLPSALTSREALDRTQSSLLAGLLGGLALAFWPPAVLGVLCGLLGLFLVTWRVSAEERAGAAQAGLLYAMTAAVLAGAPTWDGPWEGVRTGAIPAWSAGVSRALFLCAVPFLVVALRRGARSSFRWAWGGALVAAAVLAPLGARSLIASAGPVLLGGAAELEPVGRGAQGVLAASLAAGAAVVLALAALGDRERIPFVYLAAWLLSSALLSAAGGAAGEPLLWVALAAAGTALGAAVWARGNAPARVAVAGSFCALAAAGGAGAGTGAEAEEETGRHALVHMLRELRTSTPSPGPWNAAHASFDWSVWCPPAVAGLVAYHARRPAVSFDVAWEDAEQRRRRWAEHRVRLALVPDGLLPADLDGADGNEPPSSRQKSLDDTPPEPAGYAFPFPDAESESGFRLVALELLEAAAAKPRISAR